MKVFNLAIIALLINGGEAITIRPNNISDVQINQQSKAKSMIEANTELFMQLGQKIQAVQKSAAKGDDAGASLQADGMN